MTKTWNRLFAALCLIAFTLTVYVAWTHLNGMRFDQL